MYLMNIKFRGCELKYKLMFISFKVKNFEEHGLRNIVHLFDLLFESVRALNKLLLVLGKSF